MFNIKYFNYCNFIYICNDYLYYYRYNNQSSSYKIKFSDLLDVEKYYNEYIKLGFRFKIKYKTSFNMKICLRTICQDIKLKKENKIKDKDIYNGIKELKIYNDCISFNYSDLKEKIAQFILKKKMYFIFKIFI